MVRPSQKVRVRIPVNPIVAFNNECWQLIKKHSNGKICINLNIIVVMYKANLN